MAVLKGFPPLQVGIHRVDMGALGYLFGTLVIVWSLNLFNFMDGIDGIAASEAVFIGVAGGVLVLVGGGSVALATLCLVLAAACSGFLWWNWAPAKIFMGDVGSGFLGFSIAVLALGVARDQPAGPFVWLILGGVFVVDATVTLMRRLWRRERLYEAHRSHAYQCLARRWQSHRRVTLTVTAVNVFWLFPWATLATLYPVHAGWAALAAVGPLLVAAVAVGAGRQEPRAAPEA
jgi:Fuc2NAc and GlcNAc transferase